MARDCQQSARPKRGAGGGGEQGCHVGTSYNQRERVAVKGKPEFLIRDSHSGGNLIEILSSSSDEDGDDDEHKKWNNSGKNSKNLASGSRIVRGISSPSSGKNEKKNTGFLKSMKEKKREEEEDEECVTLDYDPLQPPTIDFKDKLFVSESDHHHPLGFEGGEFIISERGKVACRDYPHSRHHCANYPFNKTCHERCCPQCYCYVCDVVAPCKYWKGHDGHCHASDHDEIWKIRREIHTQMPLRTRY